MSRAILFLLLAAILLCGSSPAQVGQVASKFQPDKYIFKGRLIGVQFTRKPNETTIVLTLQFMIEDPIADSRISEVASLANVATDTQFDPSRLTAANYREAMERAIGNGVQLGGSCLVISNWPGARGKELLSIQTWTKEAEARIRAENRDYIAEFRRLNNRNAFGARMQRLDAQSIQVDRYISILTTDPKMKADDRKTFIDALQTNVEGVQSDFNALAKEISDRREELNTVMSGVANDEFESQTLAKMLDDLKDIESEIHQRRNSVMKSLRVAGFESMMPE